MSVVPIQAARIALPASLQSKPIGSLLPPALSSEYADPANFLRPAAEVAALNADKPLGKPRISGDRTEYIQLLKRMLSVGMLTFTDEPKAINSFFAVAKDADADRLILDARWANRLFVEPRRVALPNASHLAQLSFPFGAKLHCAKSDLSNFYHQLRLPDAWQPYFALPSLTVEECGQLGVSSNRPYPMCTTLPMGFSHAVVLAQAVHEFVLYKDGRLKRANNILEHQSPGVDRCLHLVYIDDFVMLALDRLELRREFGYALDAYARYGLPENTKKRIAPPDQPNKVTAIGIEIDGSRLTLSIAAHDRIKLMSNTLTLLRARTVSGHDLSRVIGSWVWCLMLRRAALVVLNESYRYLRVAEQRRFTLWPSVRDELLCLMTLAPLLQTDMAAPFHHRVYASDASEVAAGVVSTPLTDQLQARLYPLSHVPAFNLLPVSALYNARMIDSPITANPPELLAHYATAAGTELLQSVSAARWSVLVSSRWHHRQHINALELHAALLSLRHALSQPNAACSRIFMLVDSSVAYYALWKGRTSSRPIMHVLRQINALLLVSGCSLQCCWIPSSSNPADAPSRLRPLPPPCDSLSVPHMRAPTTDAALSDSAPVSTAESLQRP
jgi:hypothetical protein